MHWLTILGVGLIAAGTFCTYLGVEMKHKKTSSSPASHEEADALTLLAEQQELLKMSKEVQQENERLRADNTTLSLKLRRTEEDVDVYKYRSNELQQMIEELKQKPVTSYSRQEHQQDEVPAAPVISRIVEQPVPIEPPVQRVREETEMEVIERLQGLLADRDYAELKQAAQEQVALNADWLTPYVYLGVACRHLGERQQALQQFVYVVENGAGDPAYPQAERALKLMTTGIQDMAERGDWKALANTTEQLIQQEPDWYLSYYFGGLAQTHVGNKAKALQYLETFVANSPNDPEYGRAAKALRLLKTNILELQRRGDYPALIRACEHEIESDPTWMTPYYLLGLAYARLGNTAKARENLEIFVRRAGDDSDYANAQRLLDSLE